MPITQSEGKYGDALKLLKPHLPAIGLSHTQCESYDRKPQHRTGYAITDYFLESGTSNCDDCSDNCGYQTKCQGLLFHSKRFCHHHLLQMTDPPQSI